MTFSPHFRITHPITSGLAKIERARAFWEAARLSPEWLAEMQKRALVLEAHHTTHIEGTKLTLAQSEKLLQGLPVPEADPEDSQELLNYREAFDLVAHYLNSGDPITEGLIREIHKRLVRGVRGDSAAPGEYRKIQNYVVHAQTGEVVYTPPPGYEVPRMMTDLVAWLNAETDIHTALQAGLAQFQLVHIHPFLDGNGRTARLLSTLCLYRGGYDFKQLFSISEYYDRNRPAYYQALPRVRDQEMDLTGWLEYFVAGLAFQMREVQKRGEGVIQRDRILSRARKAGLKDRPVAVLALVLDRGRATVSELETSLQQNRRTLQRDLRLLVKEGFVREVSTSRTDPTKYYEPKL